VGECALDVIRLGDPPQTACRFVESRLQLGLPRRRLRALALV
jgi:hypothetical protein